VQQPVLFFYVQSLARIFGVARDTNYIIYRRERKTGMCGFVLEGILEKTGVLIQKKSSASSIDSVLKFADQQVNESVF
jgi:hypothetical protein